MWRILLALLLLYCVGSASAELPHGIGPPAWSRILLGNGGAIMTVATSPDGNAKFAIPDGQGCYEWSTQYDQWVQLINVTALPANAQAINTDHTPACDEIRPDPQNSSIIWLQSYGNVYRSTNGGSFGAGPISNITFADTNLPILTRGVAPSSLSYVKGRGPWLAIDPNNSDVVYASTPDTGLYRTINGTAAANSVSWSQITDVLAALPVYINNNPTPAKVGTDSTSVTIGTGSKTFSNNSSTGFSFSAGSTNYVHVWETSDFTKQMFGYVTAANGPGKTFTLNVLFTTGSGTFSDWSVGFQNQVPGGGHAIAFDTSGGTTIVNGQTRTKNIYECTYALGCWQSTDGGMTWTELNSAGMPTSYRRMVADPNGVLWIATDDYTSPTDAKYYNGTWNGPISVSGGTRWFNWVTVDTSQCPVGNESACHIIFGGHGIIVTTNGGSTWTLSGNGNSPTFNGAGDVGWTANFNGSGWGWTVNGTDAFIDPLNANRLYLTSEGVWYFTVPSVATANLAFTEQTSGIEEFVVGQIISPASPGGTIIAGLWDVPCLYNSYPFNTYPSHVSCLGGDGQISLLRGYSLDWLGSNPLYIAALVNGDDSALSWEVSGYSTNGGQSAPNAAWKRFSSFTASRSWTTSTPIITLTVSVPSYVASGYFVYDATIQRKIGIVKSKSGSTITLQANAAYASSGSSDQLVIQYETHGGGCIAWGPTSSIIYRNAAINAGPPTESTDGGQSFAPISISGGTPTTGWSPLNTVFTTTKPCDSDKTNGDIYVYNWNIDGANTNAVYKRDHISGTWAQAAITSFSQAYLNEQIKSVPGQAGTLFFTSGLNAGTHPAAFSLSYFTTDGWLHKIQIPRFREVASWGFGATFPGKSFPSVYGAGYYDVLNNGKYTYGVWMCKDFNTSNGACTTTWQQVGDGHPFGITAPILDVDGDKVTPGRVYVISRMGAYCGGCNVPFD
jgi:hypothetical protein